MAQAVITTERLAIALNAFALMLGDVREIADEWETIEENERISLMLDWSHQVGVLRSMLDPAYRSGQMTEEQQTAYRQVLRDLAAATPLLRRIDWWVPEIPNEITG